MTTKLFTHEDSPEASASTNCTSSGEYLITHPLLQALDALFAKFFVLTSAQRLVIATWVVHTWVAEHPEATLGRRRPEETT